MTRSLVSSQSQIDQSNFVGASGIGFGTFASARYRGQCFIPTKSQMNGFGFHLNQGPFAKDMALFVTDVDQSTKLPINSPLNQWIIPNSQLVVAYKMYPLVGLAAGGSVDTYTFPQLGGHIYAFYLAPYSGGVYADQYRDCLMSNSLLGGYQTEITNTNGSWSKENLTLIFAIGYPATRTISPTRTIAPTRTIVP